MPTYYRNRKRSIICQLFRILFTLSLSLCPASAITSSNSLPLKNVVICGGTHGNEYTGVWVIKAFDRAKKLIKNQYPSLNITTLLGNPKAHMQNKRFVDADLNRKFSRESLMNDIDLENDDLPHETLRAREIDQLLGPKFASIESDDAAHVVVDLHSTTSNMGVTIIVAEGDVVMTRAAAYVRQKCEEAGEKVHCLLHTHENRQVRPNLSSTARHGFTIEVGPVPQGVIRHDAVEKTTLALEEFLKFMELSNENPDALNKILEDMYGRRSLQVPCFKSAKALREQEMSGKIAWPSVPENPNFPAYMVHKDLQDKDFELISTGDPLFVNLDGDVIPYDGAYGSPVYLMFVNEGGYYFKSSGTGIGVATKTAFDLETGMLVKTDTCTMEARV